MLETVIHYLYLGVVVALVFGLAVFVHEFGHMMFALLRGVGVESFAIGMGPKVTHWKWGGIEFSLRWFPVGGFVKLAGLMPGEGAESVEGPQTRAFEQAEQTNSVELGHDTEGSGPRGEKETKSIAESSYDDLNALANKGLLTKLLVFGGGVFMNYVTAIVAMAVYLMMPQQVPILEPTVWRVAPESVAGLAGLRSGDRIVEVNGQKIDYLYQIYEAIEEAAKTTGLNPKSDEISSLTLNLVVRRAVGGTTQSAALAPVMVGHLSLRSNADHRPEDEAVEWALPPIIGSLNLTQPAEKAGLQLGDRIVSIDDRPIRYFNDMADLISKSMDKEITLCYERKGKTETVKLTPKPGFDDPSVGRIGIYGGAAEYRSVPGIDPLTAIQAAPGATWAALKELVEKHIDFFKRATFKQVTDGLGGPVMIGRLVSQAASMGLDRLVSFFITLNLLLMVFNLLPLPVLDGGFIMISLIEAVIRRPVPARVLAPIYTVFVIFFIGLMVLITFWDVKRWIS